MIEERKFRSVSLNSDLIDGVEAAIEKKKAEIGEVLLPPEFKSAASFIAESTRLHLLQLQKAKQSRLHVRRCLVLAWGSMRYEGYRGGRRL